MAERPKVVNINVNYPLERISETKISYCGHEIPRAIVTVQRRFTSRRGIDSLMKVGIAGWKCDIDGTEEVDLVASVEALREMVNVVSRARDRVAIRQLKATLAVTQQQMTLRNQQVYG